MKEDKDLGIKVLLFVFGACIYYMVRRDAGDYYINKGIVEIFCAGFLMISSQTIMWVSRYYMPHVAVNGHSGSILGRPVVVKGSGYKNTNQETINPEWSIFNTGESLEPFHMRGKLSTLVVPTNQILRAGSNYIGRVFVRKVPFDSLPPEVYSYLVHHGSDYNKDVIYFGMYSEEFTFDNPDAIDHQSQVAKLNGQINFRNDLLEGRNDSLIEMKKMAEEVTGSNKKWYEALRRPKDADEE
jgi:hypothetical protein